jgi:putative nucleotidyltransferase with HDIG domain
VLKRSTETHWERVAQRELQRNMVENTKALEQQKTRLETALADSETMMAEMLLNTLDLRDHETRAHCRRVATYARMIAEAMGLKGRIIQSIKEGAMLHDIGKIGIPDSILLKNGPLTPEEWQVMRTHTLLGGRLLEGFETLSGAREIVLQHHERWDGTGYPGGLKEEHVCIGARIFAVADTIDAILSDRPYRKAATIDVAAAEIERCSGTQFDPRVVEAFKTIAREKWVEVRVQFPDEDKLRRVA